MKMTSNYLSKFQEAKQTFELYGNKILVERLDTGEVKTAGGIIIAENSATRPDLKLTKPHVAIVVATGKGYYDSETDSYLPLELQPGNIVILNSLGVQYYSVLPGSPSYSNNVIGITTEADVQMTFKDVEAFKQYVKIFGGFIEEA